MGIRRCIHPRQEVQDESSIEDQSVREEGLPYLMARYLNQPTRDVEMPFSFMIGYFHALEWLCGFGYGTFAIGGHMWRRPESR